MPSFACRRHHAAGVKLGGAVGIATVLLQSGRSPLNSSVDRSELLSAFASPQTQLQVGKALPTSLRVGAYPSTSTGVSSSGTNSHHLVAAGAAAAFAASLASGIRRQRNSAGSTSVRRRATTVEADPKTDLAPWEIEEETEDERNERYAREADEMKLKWDARRLEERQSAQRRQAHAQKEAERAALYGPRDLIMEAYEARMYEEARVIEVYRRQREVYERIKAAKAGKPLPPKGKPYVELKPMPVQPAAPADFDITGHYKPAEDIEAKRYKAPESYVSPTGPAPPPRHERGRPKAAWDTPQYERASSNMSEIKYPEPGSLPEDTVPPCRVQIEKERAERTARRKKLPGEEEEEFAAEVAAVAPGAAPAAKKAAAKKEEAPAAAAEASAAPARGNLPSVADVKKMTVPELKAALKEAGLKVAGNKADLVARLTEAIEG